ncbi:MAG TPA: type II secretion system protein GspM [Pseudolabrys sp.]|nr:type II secretion system protein GspM [Pseudolabrys sp.]
MIEQVRTNAWLRRGIFLAVNLIANLALLFLFVWPIQAFFAERNAQITNQRALLSRLNAVIAQQSTVDTLAAGSAVDKHRAEFLQGTNEGVIAANLQITLKGMAQTTGARVRSARTLPAKVSDDVKLIGAQIEITGPIQAIDQTVRTIEAARPFLFVVGAVLKPAQQMILQPTDVALPPQIDAQLDVVGAMQIEGKD